MRLRYEWLCSLILVTVTTVASAEEAARSAAENDQWEQTTEHVRSLKEGVESTGSHRVEDLRWLQGDWQGQGLGGDCFESWNQPFGNVIDGTFRFVVDGKLQFSEYFTIAEQEGHVELRLRHFGVDLSGWEDKESPVRFRLIDVKDRTAWFDGITYQRDAAGQLLVWVLMKKKDGSVTEEYFRFRRVVYP